MTIDRRTLLFDALAVGAGAVISGCGGQDADVYVRPDGPQVQAAERARRPGTVRDFHLVAAETTVDLGGITVPAWTYGGLPGPVVRVRAGEVVRARVTNRLPAETSVHWHGIALRNDADGVPGVTQQPISRGAEYTYAFTAPDPGTYWLHPHSGLQLERGLYAPLIVDDPADPGDYDAEWIVVLDDWLAQTTTPEQTLDQLENGGHMMMGGSGMTSDLLGDAGDIAYPYFLFNGRLSAAPQTLPLKPRTRLRIRIINAGADTAFRVALAGHRLTVTHLDGFPVRPTEIDALLIGMGERYDARVTLDEGVFPLVALAEGKNGLARGLIRTTSKAAAPAADLRPAELDHPASYAQFIPADPARLSPRRPDRTVQLTLTGGMMSYEWGVNGRTYDPSVLYPVSAGERVRLELANATMMWHPVHLHGHTFALANGLRKDTAIVLPHDGLAVDFDATNPGRWMVHCHNVYHAEAGMMALLGYTA